MRSVHNSHTTIRGTPRRAMLCGRKCLVAPVTMLVPGVRSGGDGRGPMFFPADAVARSVDTWNAKPILLDHPDDGKTGRSPEIWDRQGIGHLFNTRTFNLNLMAEAWLEIERMQRLAPIALVAIERGECVAVSIGWGGAINNTSGTHNGKVFNGRWSEIRADHLSILPNGQQGMCTVADGCGINTPQRPHRSMPLNELSTLLHCANHRSGPAPMQLLAWDDVKCS